MSTRSDPNKLYLHEPTKKRGKSGVRYLLVDAEKSSDDEEKKSFKFYTVPKSVCPFGHVSFKYEDKSLGILVEDDNEAMNDLFKKIDERVVDHMVINSKAIFGKAIKKKKAEKMLIPTIKTNKDYPSHVKFKLTRKTKICLVDGDEVKKGTIEDIKSTKGKKFVVKGTIGCVYIQGDNQFGVSLKALKVAVFEDEESESDSDSESDWYEEKRNKKHKVA